MNLKMPLKHMKQRDQKLLSIKGNKTVKEFHRDIGNLLWNYVGMGRDEKGLKHALLKKSRN